MSFAPVLIGIEVNEATNVQMRITSIFDHLRMLALFGSLAAVTWAARELRAGTEPSSLTRVLVVDSLDPG